ncbi:MAG: dephospho-CoA kinase, partial [Thermodesulfovibrionia bacterium]|nr:dephospho-CoA kinase [Thermodesulfovibrionia bacterium]
MPFIGLTGSLGTGKTTVLKIFRKLGAYTINADKLVHQILKKPAIIKKLSATLGKDILIKRASKILISKKRVADIIFNDPRKRKAVEKIIHPDVIKTAKDIKTKILAKKSDAIIVFEVPLLLEAGYEKIFDKIIVVYCSKEIAVNRVLRHGLSRKQALQRMRAQLPISRKKAAADFLINNNLSISNTKSQVKEIF